MQTSYKKKKYMHTYNIVPCKHNTFGEIKLDQICISFLCFKGIMPSCYTYMTWLSHEVMFMHLLQNKWLF